MSNLNKQKVISIKSTKEFKLLKQIIKTKQKKKRIL